MKQAFTTSQTISLNFNDYLLPENARRVRPTVWKENEMFCVLSGVNSNKEIFGCGRSLEAALNDWNRNLVERRTSGEIGAADFIYMQYTKVAC